MKRLWFLILVVLVSFSACKKKTIPQTTETKGTNEKAVPAIRSEFVAWPTRYWTAKAKIHLSIGGNTFPVNLTIRTEENQCIWFSANAMGLMEIARGKIDRDSVKVLDKFNNRCFVGGMDGLGDYLPMSLNIKQLQHFLMGKVFWDSLDAGNRKVSGDTTFLEGKEGLTSFSAKLLRKFNLLSAGASPDGGETVVTLSNDQFRDVSGFSVAHKKEVVSCQKTDGKMNESRVRIEFNRFEFVSEAPDLSFQLPDDCTRQVLK